MSRRQLAALAAELRQLDGWPDVQLHGALLAWDLLRAVGFGRRRTAALLGFDGDLEAAIIVLQPEELGHLPQLAPDIPPVLAGCPPGAE